MSAPAFYADLGIGLPDRGGPNLQVRCFASPEAHRREDHNPSCSVNGETGAYCCHGCGAKGGPYDAAVTLGKSPAEAMELLRRHGLADDDGEQPAPQSRPKPKAAPRPSQAALDSYRGALEADAEALARLETLRGWTADAVRALGLGLDGARVVFPVRDADGALVNLLRHLPDPKGRNGGPKLLAESGCRRDLFPAPETLEGDETWLVEGEPDAVAAHSLGLAAVAVPGANGWRPEWAERFAGRRVVVLLDCDHGSREAAGQFARDLLEHAAEVCVLDLDPTRDDGHDLGDELREAAAHGEAGRVRLRRALERMAADAARLEPPKPEDGAALLDDLAAFVRRFVVVTDAQAVVVALWIAHAHAFEASRVTPYLAITSAEPGSGKTLLLEVLAQLVPRPWLTGRTTAAVLPRKIERVRPTLLLDESDAAFRGDKDYAEALRGVLNSGYKRSGATTVCVGQGANIDFRDFSTYCPKAIAGIGTLPDTVRDRALPIRLERIAPDEEVEEFDEELAEPAAADLRDRLERFAASAGGQLRGTRPDVVAGLGARTKEVIRPLLAIADVAAGSWPEQARRAVIELHGGEPVEDGSQGIRLLADIRAVFDERGADRIRSTDLLTDLAGIDEAPWAEWGKAGRPLTTTRLANLLWPYRIRSRTVRLADGNTPKGYKREQFEDAWRRYLPSNPPASRHNATTRMETGIEADPDPPQDHVVAGGEEAENPHGEWDVADVADRTAGHGNNGSSTEASDAFLERARRAYERGGDGICRDCGATATGDYARCLPCDMAGRES
ncbi:MAG TPA: DUF3631 domain-containing protein [Thermoleophilaceae bacterium]|nr:DUF3631 domain-containing protein [Thermoleophilaceae bacterium]